VPVTVVPEEGFEPSRPCEQRILSPSCLPFHHSGRRAKTRRCILPFGTIAGVVEFAVGIIVGASAALLLVILVGPSRRVRAERPLPREVEAKLLLGQDPDQPTIPPPPRTEHPRHYSPNELAALQRLGEPPRRRRRR
jgi:hypothetical protein